MTPITFQIRTAPYVRWDDVIGQFDGNRNLRDWIDQALFMNGALSEDDTTFVRCEAIIDIICDGWNDYAEYACDDANHAQAREHYESVIAALKALPPDVQIAVDA